MNTFCANHPEEKAVGFCGSCHAPSCYRCSLNVDMVVYCSLECFNSLNPPSVMDAPKMPAKPADAPSPAAAPKTARKFDEAAEVLSAVPKAKPPAPAPADPAAGLRDATVVLSAEQAHKDNTETDLLQSLDSDHTSLLDNPTFRVTASHSSCFFHPDSSAVTLCVECKNPICALCSRQTPAGMACSPSCGPPDLARERERRTAAFFNMALAAAIALFLVGAVVLLRAWGQAAAPVLRAPESETEPTPSRVAVRPETPPDEPFLLIPLAAPPPARSAIDVPRSESPRPARYLASPTPAPDPAPAPVDLPLPAPPEPVRPVAAPPRAPEPPKRTAFELDVQWAESLVRDADALIKEVDAVMTPQWVPGPDTNTLGVKLSRANTKLKQARTLYSNRIAQAPDPELLKSRVAAISKSLDEVQLRFDRLGGRTQSHR